MKHLLGFFAQYSGQEVQPEQRGWFSWPDTWDCWGCLVVGTPWGPGPLWLPLNRTQKAEKISQPLWFPRVVCFCCACQGEVVQKEKRANGISLESTRCLLVRTGSQDAPKLVLLVGPYSPDGATPRKDHSMSGEPSEAFCQHGHWRYGPAPVAIQFSAASGLFVCFISWMAIGQLQPGGIFGTLREPKSFAATALCRGSHEETLHVKGARSRGAQAGSLGQWVLDGCSL